jgi:mannose-6-phosphate isomerase
LLGRYRRPDGLFRFSVHLDGTPADDAAWAYDQAFALFALANAYAALPDRSDLRDIALDLARRLDSLRLPAGGFIEASPTLPYQSNPHMHLLEAFLAWEAVDPGSVWPALADEMVGLCLARFLDEHGQLHEFFAGDWSFEPGIDGRVVWPGHQFEWAWLLERWARLRGDAVASQVALRLYDVGKAGVDLERGVCHQQLLDDGTVHDPVGRLWPQTERIKAALIFDDEVGALRGIGGLKLYLATPTPGLWWDRCKPDGSFVDEPAPASSFYHIACAIAELAGAR